MPVVVALRERRAALRVDVSMDGFITELEEQGVFAGDGELLAPLWGRVLNLSKTGLLIETEEPVCPGREVSVSLRFDGVALEVRGYVVRAIEPVCDSDPAAVAVELFDLEPALRARMDALICAHRSDPVLN